jgi:hypothetical protein
MTMRRRICGTAAAVVAGTLTLASAHAHHSYAAFDQCTPVTLEGEIDDVEWANPHIRILLRTREAGSYSIEWFSLIQMQRAALEPGTLKSGDHEPPPRAAADSLARELHRSSTLIEEPPHVFSFHRRRAAARERFRRRLCD